VGEKEEDRTVILRATALGLLLQACAAPDPGEADRLYQEALFRLSREDDPAPAILLLDRALRIDPSRADFLAARAAALRAAGRLDEAEADYARAIDIRRGSPPDERAVLHLARGIFLAGLGRAGEAEADFSEAIRLTPDLQEAYLRRARLRRLDGRPDEAAQDEAEARRRGAGRADAFYNEGVRALNRGARDEAEICFSFAAGLDPRHLQAHVALGRVFMELRRFAEAARSYDRAVELEPGRADLHYHRANAHLAEGRPAEAVSDYTRALELDPMQASYFAARGAAYHRSLHDTVKAREDFARAIDRDPGCRAAWADSGVLFHDLGLLDEAERRLRKALEIAATPDTLRALGLLLLDKGDRDRAADALRKAMGICRDEALRKAIEGDLERARKESP
jgi:tetratricopeptide (TPR) repeat protein